jgi:hypothetical protein
MPNFIGEGTVGGQPIPPGVDPLPEPEVTLRINSLFFQTFFMNVMASWTASTSMSSAV